MCLRCTSDPFYEVPHTPGYADSDSTVCSAPARTVDFAAIIIPNYMATKKNSPKFIRRRRQRVCHVHGLVDRDGTGKLTMRRLGTELGVDPMAVYYYLPNKAALFDGITEAIWSSIDLDSINPDDSWQQQLSTAMHVLRNTLHAHPRAVAILGTRPVTSPELFTLLERMLGVLVKAGMPADTETADLLNTLVAYTIGHVLAEVGEPIDGGPTAPTYQALSPQTHPQRMDVQPRRPIRPGPRRTPHRLAEHAEPRVRPRCLTARGSARPGVTRSHRVAQ